MKSKPTYASPKFVAVILLAVTAIALPFILIPYGFWPADEPYQILLAMDYRANPVAFLSSWLFGVWGNIFGFDLIMMRVFAAILSTATVAIAGYVFYCHTRQPLKSIVVASIANIVLTAHQSQSYAVGWDVVSNLFLVAALAAILATVSVNRRSIGLAAILGIVSALAVASRLPNAIIIPFVVLLLLIKRKWAETAVYVAVATATAVVVIFAFYGSIGDYTTRLSDYLSQQIATEHDTHQLLDAFIIGMNRIKPLALAVFALLAIGVVGEKCKIPDLMWFAVVLIPVAIICYPFLVFNRDNQMISDILAVVVCSLILLSLFSQAFDKKYNRFWFAAALLSFFIVPNVGSNAFWSKFLAAQLLPIALIPFVKSPSQLVKGALAFIGGTLLILLPILKVYYTTWLDSGIYYCDYKFTQPHLEGIHTGKGLGNEIDEIAKLASEGCIVVGDGWQTFDYIGVCPRIDDRLINHFGIINGTLLNSKEYVDLFADTVRERKRKFVVIDLLLGKHYDPWMYRTRMYYLLTDNGYTHVQGGWKYVVYEPGR